ncbi:MAG: hypothetical protein V4623_02330 [Pseudomonadota bacterium]
MRWSLPKLSHELGSIYALRLAKETLGLLQTRDYAVHAAMQQGDVERFNRYASVLLFILGLTPINDRLSYVKSSLLVRYDDKCEELSSPALLTGISRQQSLIVDCYREFLISINDLLPPRDAVNEAARDHDMLALVLAEESLFGRITHAEAQDIPTILAYSELVKSAIGTEPTAASRARWIEAILFTLKDERVITAFSAAMVGKNPEVVKICGDLLKFLIHGLPLEACKEYITRFLLAPADRNTIGSAHALRNNKVPFVEAYGELLISLLEYLPTQGLNETLELLMRPDNPSESSLILSMMASGSEGALIAYGKLLHSLRDRLPEAQRAPFVASVLGKHRPLSPSVLEVIGQMEKAVKNTPLTVHGSSAPAKTSTSPISIQLSVKQIYCGLFVDTARQLLDLSALKECKPEELATLLKHLTPELKSQIRTLDLRGLSVAQLKAIELSGLSSLSVLRVGVSANLKSAELNNFLQSIPSTLKAQIASIEDDTGWFDVLVLDDAFTQFAPHLKEAKMRALEQQAATLQTALSNYPFFVVNVGVSKGKNPQARLEIKLDPGTSTGDGADEYRRLPLPLLAAEYTLERTALQGVADDLKADHWQALLKAVALSDVAAQSAALKKIEEALATRSIENKVQAEEKKLSVKIASVLEAYRQVDDALLNAVRAFVVALPAKLALPLPPVMPGNRPLQNPPQAKIPQAVTSAFSATKKTLPDTTTAEEVTSQFGALQGELQSLGSATLGAIASLQKGEIDALLERWGELNRSMAEFERTVQQCRNVYRIAQNLLIEPANAPSIPLLLRHFETHPPKESLAAAIATLTELGIEGVEPPQAGAPSVAASSISGRSTLLRNEQALKQGLALQAGEILSHLTPSEEEEDDELRAADEVPKEVREALSNTHLGPFFALIEANPELFPNAAQIARMTKPSAEEVKALRQKQKLMPESRLLDSFKHGAKQRSRPRSQQPTLEEVTFANLEESLVMLKEAFAADKLPQPRLLELSDEQQQAFCAALAAYFAKVAVKDTGAGSGKGSHFSHSAPIPWPFSDTVSGKSQMHAWQITFEVLGNLIEPRALPEGAV